MKFSGVNEVVQLFNEKGEVIVTEAIKKFDENQQLISKEQINFKEVNNFNKEELNDLLSELFKGKIEISFELLKEINLILTYNNDSNCIEYPTDVENHSKID